MEKGGFCKNIIYKYFIWREAIIYGNGEKRREEI
jgi:hypothetical protein